MKWIRFFLLGVFVFSGPVVHAFPDGLQLGVGASALSGMNVIAGYRHMDSNSLLDRFGVRFDFADTGPLKSAIDSAIDHIMSDGIDVGNGVRIDEGQIDSSHYGL